MMHYGYGMMGGYGIIIPIILIGLIIYAVIKLTQSSQKNHSNSKALDILNERYANGEITEEEYKLKKKTLRD